jgi:serine/threonine protein kinase
MALTVGDHLGHYDVTAKIGEGGMGEVYRARDTKLDRDVNTKSNGVNMTNSRQLVKGGR